MKKIIYGWMAILVMAIGVGFAACGSDDDGGGDSDLVGTWVYSHTYTSGSVTYQQTTTVTFKSNHTGVAIFSEKAIGGSGYTHNDYTDTSTFTWSTSGNKLYVTTKHNGSYSGEYTETTVGTYVISGNTLALTWEEDGSYSGSSSSKYTTIYEKQ